MEQDGDWFSSLIQNEKKIIDDRSWLRCLDGTMKWDGRGYGVGRFGLLTLKTLKHRAQSIDLGKRPQLAISVISEDIVGLHRNTEYDDAVFQVAGNFDCSADDNKERALAVYANKRSQAVLCAKTTGAATIYRKYYHRDKPFALAKDKAYDLLERFQGFLAGVMHREPSSLWMPGVPQPMLKAQAMSEIDTRLRSLDEDQLRELGEQLFVGVQSGAEVTVRGSTSIGEVTHVLCAALQNRERDPKSALLRSVLLEASYEATLLAALLHAEGGGSPIVVLTLLGTGVLQVPKQVCYDAIQVALKRVGMVGLDIRINDFDRNKELAAGIDRLAPLQATVDALNAEKQASPPWRKPDDWVERLFAMPESRLVALEPNFSPEVGDVRSAQGHFQFLPLKDLAAGAVGAEYDEGNTLDAEPQDAKALFRWRHPHGAVVQVRSKFDLLLDVEPGRGVSDYAKLPGVDAICAVAAGVATTTRACLPALLGARSTNGRIGFDALFGVRSELARIMGRPEASLWTLVDGQPSIPGEQGGKIADCLSKADQAQRRTIKDAFHVGVHWDTEITESDALVRPKVIQVICGDIAAPKEQESKGVRDDLIALAELLREAADEAVLLVGVLNVNRGMSRTVYMAPSGGEDDTAVARTRERIETLLGRVPNARLQVKLMSAAQEALENMPGPEQAESPKQEDAGLPRVESTGDRGPVHHDSLAEPTDAPFTVKEPSPVKPGSGIVAEHFTGHVFLRQTGKALPPEQQTNWFQKLTGFTEFSAVGRSDPEAYRKTQQLLARTPHTVASLVNACEYRCGPLTTPSLAKLRKRASQLPASPSRTSFKVLQADVRVLLNAPESAGSLFQVASQFNLLEMVSHHVTPEHGVTEYRKDMTQGPICAIATGAATLFRNYLVPMAGGQFGQTADRQINTFADLDARLHQALDLPGGRRLWSVKNGWLMTDSLSALNQASTKEKLGALLGDPNQVDSLAQSLRIGLHAGVEVTTSPTRHLVSLALCSAIPINAQSRELEKPLAPLARLVLRALYEATLLESACRAALQHAGSNRVYLTMVGGGAFGNDEAWILEAIRAALKVVEYRGLEVILVSYAQPSGGLLQLEKDWIEAV
ncbi:conserved hypothetical protein [Burkholderiales bacterium 8X]|nr:conserved hypothetical protein [Burkholderiales bacterium 8X]